MMRSSATRMWITYDHCANQRAPRRSPPASWNDSVVMSMKTNERSANKSRGRSGSRLPVSSFTQRDARSLSETPMFDATRAVGAHRTASAPVSCSVAANWAQARSVHKLK